MILIAGPPCGGKTTYVKNHALPQDVILDYDDITEELGAERYSATPQIKALAREIWGKRLPEAKWVVWTAPRRGQRGSFRAQFGCKSIVVMAPEAECIRRARLERPHSWERAIHEWFRLYQPSSSDQETVLRVNSYGSANLIRP